MKRELRVYEERFAYREPFRIAGHLFTETTVLVAEIEATGSNGAHVGRGEAAGVYYLGDDIAHMRGEVERVRADIEAGAAGREELQSLLPPGGARNALDCALWDLDAKLAGVPAWKLAGFERLEPLATTMTIGADTPEKMAAIATGRFGAWPMLKLKLTGEAALDRARVRTVRAARPDAWIGVDANQGYGLEDLPNLLEVLAASDVALLEQPLPRGREAELARVKRAIPFAADESVCTLAEVERAPGCFDVVNIKLDKCGGLTEGLAIARRCKALGLKVMVGNMMGSSLSMAPSLVVGQLCDVVDLDGPTFLAQDRDPGVIYADGRIESGAVAWGVPDRQAARL
jgi:L-alanine-DL-glutamate epimerase-like enolase superfamily enzyme